MGYYRAPPVRRHYIRKADGRQRGLGIPSFADKVAQRAIVTLLESIYEQDFLDCSRRLSKKGRQRAMPRGSATTVLGGGGQAKSRVSTPRRNHDRLHRHRGGSSGRKRRIAAVAVAHAAFVGLS